MGSSPESALRPTLLRWFDQKKRDLPWRASRDPYRVYLSEIMLQQTRVETVIPYFERFVAAFPDVRALAAAPLDEVLRLWSGLGYYRRARSMHLAAREVAERFGGRFPRTREELESLPGIGAYTAGAVASIAFDREEALVDGNVARVLSRVFEIDDAIGSKESTESLWARARELVVGERPGDLNQALMELGATVCKPGDPDCKVCPIAKACGAYRSGRQKELPVPKERRAPKRVELLAIVVIDARGRILMAKRAETGLFGGLWEPPLVAPDDGLVSELGTLERLGRVEHVLTHRILSVTLVATRIEPAGLPPGYVEMRFQEQGAELGISSLAKRILALAAERAPHGTASAKRPSSSRAKKATGSAEGRKVPRGRR